MQRFDFIFITGNYIRIFYQTIPFLKIKAQKIFQAIDLIPHCFADYSFCLHPVGELDSF